jgi:uncharacterized damage-inducible protein DinB
MKAIDVIRNAMQFADQSTLSLIEDMRDAALTQPTPRGGNHPLWVLGHITFVEGNIPHVILGEPNPVKHWAPLFAPGTEPVTDASAYPALEEILRTYRDLRGRNMRILEQFGEEGMDRQTAAPPKGLEHVLGTVGTAFLTIALHQMSHRGQVADARRAAGRKPVFTPNLN